MTYEIFDHNQLYILIADSNGGEMYVPKLLLSTTVAEPYITLNWSVIYQAGLRNSKTFNYQDISQGYGYGSTYASAQAAADAIWLMQISAFSGGGDILTAKGDLLSHSGTSDGILSVGTNGRFLKANSSALLGIEWAELPTSPRYVPVQFFASSFASPAQNATYYFGGIPSRTPATTITREQGIIPVTGTLKAVYLQATWGNTPSANSHTFNVRINNSTDALITNSQAISGASPAVFSNTSMSQAVTAGDLFAIKWQTPATWATPATNIIWNGVMVIEL